MFSHKCTSLVCGVKCVCCWVGRRGGLHLSGGPGDALPHREADEEALRHWLPGVWAQHHPGLLQTGVGQVALYIIHTSTHIVRNEWLVPDSKVIFGQYVVLVFQKTQGALAQLLLTEPFVSSSSVSPLQKYPDHAILKVLHLMLRRGELQHRMQRKVLYRVK